MRCESLLTLDEAATYVGYKNTRSFVRGWVVKHKVPYEMRGRQKFFMREILDRYLIKVAEATARKVY